MSLEGAKRVRQIICETEDELPRLRPLSVAEFLQLELPPREVIVEPFRGRKGSTITSRGDLRSIAGLVRAAAATCPLSRRRNAGRNHAGAARRDRRRRRCA